MKKYFKNFAIIWLCGVIMFAVVALLVNILTPDFPDASFWISYIFVLIAFAIQFVAAKKFFSEDDKDKVFLNMPLIRISKTCVIVSAILGTVLMVIPGIPFFVGAVVAAAVILFSIVALVKADTAAEAVQEVEEKVKAQTSFIKLLTVDAESLMSYAKTDEAKAACKKVYEAVRYSPKMSNDSLSDIENKITVKMDEFSKSVIGDKSNPETVADELVMLIEDRNKKCKVLK